MVYFFRTSHATSRKNMYDGIDEYYVVVKESGSREEEETQEEIRNRKEKESDEAPTELFFPQNHVYNFSPSI